MSFDKTIIPKVMSSLLAITRRVLQSEAVVTVTGSPTMEGDVDELKLHDLTAIAGLGGPISLLIAFSFEAPLLDAIYQGAVATISVPEGEEDTYRRDAAGEFVNTILGLCTADFQNIERSITLSPPVIMEHARCIHRPKNAVFACMKMATERGVMTVSFVGPRELFDSYLNYQLVD
jgi:CheY-specific phosphatase CheX